MPLTLVRHGRTEANAAGRLQGRMDNPLDEAGRQQARAIGTALASVDRLVSSPLRRAVDTAALALPGMAPELDERWLELDYGDLEGVPVTDVPAATWSRWRSDSEFRPTGGETLAELGVRVRAALEELAHAAVSDHVVIVSHVSPIKAAMAWALGVVDGVAWRCRLDAASITRISVGREGPALVSFNDTHHLTGS